MFKPKKFPKYCKKCGKLITIKSTPVKYDTETGEIIKERRVAHCWNTTYSDMGINGHYFKYWYTKIDNIV